MMNRRHFLAATFGVATVAVLVEVRHALAQTAGRSGTFEGRSRHDTSGGATLDGSTIRLHADFNLDSGPDPIVGLGKDGVWDPDSYAGDLASLNGAQEYALPASVNAEDYNEVYIWCRAADVPLGIATLN